MQNSLSRWLQEPTFQRLLIILIGAAIVLLISYYLKQLLLSRVKEPDHRYRSRKIVNGLSYLLIVTVVLFVYSDKLGNIGITLGLASAGIAFALQEVITSAAGWLSIMTSNSISIGQRIKVGEIKGDIIDIGVLKTTIMEVGDWIDGDLYNGRITHLANSFVFKEPIQNYSADYPFLWDEITVPIRTESDYTRARQIFQNVATTVCGDYAIQSKAVWEKMTDKYKAEDADVLPMVTLKFDENWITFTIRYVVDYKKRRSTKDKLYTGLLAEIAKHDDIIMIATSSMEITNVSNSSEN